MFEVVITHISIQPRAEVGVPMSLGYSTTRLMQTVPRKHAKDIKLHQQVSIDNNIYCTVLDLLHCKCIESYRATWGHIAPYMFTHVL